MPGISAGTGNDVTVANISAITNLNISNIRSSADQKITDLTDIEAFTSLTELYCHSNQLMSLDVSTNTALTLLSCFDNQLTELNVSTNTALTGLYCYINSLTSLNIANGNNHNFFILTVIIR